MFFIQFVLAASKKDKDVIMYCKHFMNLVNRAPNKFPRNDGKYPGIYVNDIFMHELDLDYLKGLTL